MPLSRQQGVVKRATARSGRPQSPPMWLRRANTAPLVGMWHFLGARFRSHLCRRYLVVYDSFDLTKETS